MRTYTLTADGYNGGLSYLPPEVFNVRPTQITYASGAYVTVFGRYFGPESLFDKVGKYIGPMGPYAQSSIDKPQVYLIMKDGAVVKCLHTRYMNGCVRMFFLAHFL
jgi:hypothetical protein